MRWCGGVVWVMGAENNLEKDGRGLKKDETSVV
jgi:hypothetical protein